MELDALSVVEGVQRARDPECAWQSFRSVLAADGFDQLSCFFGVPWSEPFPDAPKGCVPFFRDSLAPVEVIEFFARHPEYKCNNPIARHVRSFALRPLLRVGEDPSVPFTRTHLQMLDGLRDVFGDWDFNVFPISSAAAREYGSLAIRTRRTREARRHLERRRDALHLAGLYFYGAMRARFPGPSASASVVLSPRQQECLAWVAAGLTSDEIAARLKLSRKTIDLHVAAAMRKLEAGSRSQAAARAVALNLVRP